MPSNGSQVIDEKPLYPDISGAHRKTTNNRSRARHRHRADSGRQRLGTALRRKGGPPGSRNTLTESMRRAASPLNEPAAVAVRSTSAAVY
ncbi:hypothetical protein EOS_10345 [Caballeronia mineralivorans PML1(12)]|uniref:Uncharacterized protein n=1 Tax=Caballeronia mineralivorans PML1(12) TaxID=908627 RepID=A0A0J1G1Z5_9BURK|nr:hypothetical protein EOS_10345 [Caballeronia mineralivorans PML1(12)]